MSCSPVWASSMDFGCRRLPKFAFTCGNTTTSFLSTAPTGTPQTAWDDWCEAVRKEVKPYYTSRFEYSLSGIQLLPEIHCLTTLSQSGRNVLSRLVLASLGSWPAGWKSATIKKLSGEAWSCPVMSPLSYWLATLPWLSDGTAVDERPLSDSFLVPASSLQGQHDRYLHLDPLSLDLSRRLETEPELKAALTMLGLKIYPTKEGDWTGPELLEALATAWTANRVPTERFDVFLGQVREAWQHFDPDKGFPEMLLVWTGQREFSTCGRDELANVYLPDNRGRTQSLLKHGKHILEMRPAAAIRMTKALLATNIRRASHLKSDFSSTAPTGPAWLTESHRSTRPDTHGCQ